MIADHTIKEMAELIGTHNPPVPAGGTTLAIDGLLGVALLQLSFKVSKKEWREGVKRKFSNYPDRFTQAEELFGNTITDDVTAFKTNQEEGFKDKDKLKTIIEVPLKAALEAKEMIILSDKLKEHIKSSVKADYKVARINLRACIKAAVEIITSNYQFFTAEDEFIVKTKKEVDQLKDFIEK